MAFATRGVTPIVRRTFQTQGLQATRLRSTGWAFPIRRRLILPSSRMRSPTTGLAGFHLRSALRRVR